MKKITVLFISLLLFVSVLLPLSASAKEVTVEPVSAGTTTEISPRADVVVVNPTHYAVAIKYDPQSTPVPQVLAKGVDFLAFKIREIAKNNNIPIVENKPLAQSLYKLVPIGGIIPQELYVAVAEVLRFVYSAKGK